LLRIAGSCVHARTLANMSLQCEATYAYRCYMTFDPIFTHAKLLVSQVKLK